jgi:hypothetical protein
MTSQMERLVDPRVTTRLTTRLHDRILRAAVAMKCRDELRDGASLAVGEKVLAATWDNGALCAVGTDRALYYQARGDPVGRPTWVRIGWEEIGSVDWDAREATLTVSDLSAAAEKTVLHLPAGIALGLLARDRVASTAVVDTMVQVGSYGRARVIGRKRPGSDAITWHVGLEEIRDDTPEMHRLLGEAVQTLRSQLGV